METSWLVPIYNMLQHKSNSPILVDSSMDRLKQLATSDDGWKLDKEKSGVLIHHRYSEDSPIVM